MGLIIPRPQMRQRECRRIETRIRRHVELMALHEASGLPRAEASSRAMADLKAEEKKTAETKRRFYGLPRTKGDLQDWKPGVTLSFDDSGQPIEMKARPALAERGRTL